MNLYGVARVHHESSWTVTYKCAYQTSPKGGSFHHDLPHAEVKADSLSGWSLPEQLTLSSPHQHSATRLISGPFLPYSRGGPPPRDKGKQTPVSLLEHTSVVHSLKTSSNCGRVQDHSPSFPRLDACVTLTVFDLVPLTVRSSHVPTFACHRICDLY